MDAKPVGDGRGKPPGSTLGRRRDASRDEDLCRAALEVLAEVGYDQLSMDAVATRAGAGKATVYRRWPGKAELVVDAVSRMRGPVQVADTGSLKGDLDAMLGVFEAANGPFEMTVTAGLVPALMRDAELRGRFWEGFVAPRRQVFVDVFTRAVARGEIAVQDVELLADVFPALVFQRVVVTGQAPDARFARRVVNELLLPMVGRAR